jgi:hypothetical protein
MLRRRLNVPATISSGRPAAIVNFWFLEANTQIPGGMVGNVAAAI